MSKHRAIAQQKMKQARELAAQCLYLMRRAPAEFHAMHQVDYQRARNRFAAYWLASDTCPPRTFFLKG
jgi:hypothetical protein